MKRLFCALLIFTSVAAAVVPDAGDETRFPRTEASERAIIYRDYYNAPRGAPRTEIIFQPGAAVERWLFVEGRVELSQLEHVVIGLSERRRLIVHFTLDKMPYFHIFPNVAVDQVSFDGENVFVHQRVGSGEYATARLEGLHVHFDSVTHAKHQAAVTATLILVTLISQPAPAAAAALITATAALILRDACARLLSSGVTSPRLRLGPWAQPDLALPPI